MTLDEVLTTVLMAVRPHLHGRHEGCTVDQLKAEVMKIFAEEPHVQEAFIAMVKSIADAARR